MSLNFCGGGGVVGPPRFEVPDEPEEFSGWGRAEVVLCSNLKCLACGAGVRHRVMGPGIRLYECDCARLEAMTARRLDLRTEFGHDDLPADWACAGHPRIRLPWGRGRTAVPDDVEWNTWFASLAEGPDQAPDARKQTIRALIRVFSLLEGTEHQAALEQAAAAALRFDDADRRDLALSLFWSDAAFASLAPLLDALEESSDPAFRRGAATALSRHLRAGRLSYGGLRERLRAAAVADEVLAGLANAFARFDREWLAARREECAAGSRTAAIVDRALSR